MACDPVTELVINESNRLLPGEIYSKTFPMSPWMRLTDRGEYPESLGYDPLTNLTAERSAPTEANPTWTDVNIQSDTIDGAEGGACLPPAHTLQFGWTKRTFNLKEYVIETPDFCAVSLRTTFEIQRQLQALWDNMGLYARELWEIRDRHEYLRLCNYKVVVDACPATVLTEGVESFASWSCGNAVSMLTQGVLDDWKMRLIRDGAGEGAEGVVDGEPQLTLITDGETSEGIFTTNGDRRSDLRYGDPAKLLRGFGMGGPYKGFYHVIDPFPIRYNYACFNGVVVLTEVAPFTIAAATKGWKVYPNPSWRTAQLTVSFIHNRKVYQQLIPRPITAPHPEWKFDPVNYTGIWRAMNIVDRKCNPDGNIIYFRGHMAAGSMPVHPEYGVAFLHKNCAPNCQLVTTCPSS